MRPLSAARPARRRLLPAFAAALLAIPAASASASPPPDPAPLLPPARAPAPVGFTAAGDPVLTASFGELGPDATVTWRICAPECGSVVGRDRLFQADGLPVGAQVEATGTAHGISRSARTPTWRGRPSPAAPAGINGELRVGRTISPAPGGWTGGWGSERSMSLYRLCRTAAGDDCRLLRPGTGTGDTLVVDPAWAGWYLGALEVRVAGLAVMPAVAYMPPAWGILPAAPAPATGPLTAAGPLAGPIPDGRPSSPPTVRGALRAGRTVRPRGGSWPDRPSAGAVWTGIRACPSRKDDDRCVALTDFSRTPGRPATADDRRPALGGGVRLDPRYLGWYVGAVDVLVRDVATAGIDLWLSMHGRTDRDAVPVPSPVIVHGPLSRTPVRLGFTPRATIRARAIVRPKRRTALATIRCRDRCVARTTVSSGGRTTRIRSVIGKGKAKRLAVRSGAVRGKRARVTIRFDHHPRVVRRTVRLVEARS